MNAGEALKILVDAGYLTSAEADKINKSKKEAERKAQVGRAREVAERAITDYFCVLLPNIKREEHAKFAKTLFNELEKDLNPPAEKEEVDPIKEFLKNIGVA